MINYTAWKAIFIFLISIFLISCSSQKTDVTEGTTSPNIMISDLQNGQPVEISSLKGKVIFVNFWASWCMPCKEEMSSIEALHRDMLANNRFAMITILYKDSPDTASAYMKSMGYTFPVFSDINGASAKNFGVTGVPETYLIDKKGILRKRVIGPADWNSAEAKNYINSLISE